MSNGFVAMAEENQCPKCQSFQVIRKGRILNKRRTRWKRAFLCQVCAHKFASKEVYDIDFAKDTNYVPKTLPKRDWELYTFYQNFVACRPCA